MNALTRLLEEKGVLLGDGGTGTGLFARGLMSGDSPELWNVDAVERVVDLHREFVDAGSDILLTNSFGANGFRLKLHKAQDRVHELNVAAAKAARTAADEAPREVLVAGSIGPTGEIFAPVGALDPAAAAAGFKEQAEALAAGGVDLLWIETMSAFEEVEAAIGAATTTGLPVVATMSFDTNGRTMMGITPADAARRLKGLPVPPAGYGANCGTGAAQLVATLLGFGAGEDANDLIVAKGNCGIPEYRDGHIHYSGTPEIMADYTRLARAAGARIIGGCCGTTGAHLRAMRAVLDHEPKAAPPDLVEIEARLGSVQEVTTPKGGRERRRRRA